MNTEKEYFEKMDISKDMEIITWPESQIYMEKYWFKEEAQLINDKLGLELFGGSAYLIPKNRI